MAQTKERKSKYKQLNTELPNSVYEEFTIRATQQRISKCELNRRLIIEYLKNG